MVTGHADAIILIDACLQLQAVFSCSLQPLSYIVVSSSIRHKYDVNSRGDHAITKFYNSTDSSKSSKGLST